MKEILITVKDKIATAKDSEYIVNGNSDVAVRFVFDSQWDDVGTKTAVFVLSDGSAYYKELKDGTCSMPVLYNTAYVKIGVTSARVCTSTSATVKCRPCVMDDAIGTAAENRAAVNQLCDIIDKRVPPKGTEGDMLVAGENGGTWVPPATVLESYIKKENSLPQYWSAYLAEKINTVKALQDAGGKDSFSFVVLTDMHYPSNLGKLSPAIAKELMDSCHINHALVLGDVRTRSCYNTKEQCEAEWQSIEEMLKPLQGKILQTQGNHDAGYGKGDYDADGDEDTYAYELTPAEVFNKVYRKASALGSVYDKSGTAYYVDDASAKVRYILLNTQLNFNGSYGSYETLENGMAKYPSMWRFRYTQCQYDFLIDALKGLPNEDWGVVIGSHAPINQSGEMPEYPVMVGVLNAFQNKTAYSGEYIGTAAGGFASGYTNLADPTSAEWQTGYRLNSSGNVEAQSGTTVSNIIPCKKGDVVRIKGVTPRASADRITTVASNGTKSNTAYFSGLPTTAYGYVVNGDVLEITPNVEACDGIRFAMPTPADASTIIITVNEEIKEPEVVKGYDYVSVNADFSDAKGELICYNAGHVHKDRVSTTCYPSGALEFPIIMTRCDAHEEPHSTEEDMALYNQRVAGTVTEQSFDVFTVNKATRTIYATKIGAGDNRVIYY